MTFVGTVGTFKPATLTESLQRFLCNDMPAGHHHRRVLISSLLLRNRADKYGMEEIRRRQGNLNLDGARISKGCLLFLRWPRIERYDSQVVRFQKSIRFVSLS